MAAVHQFTLRPVDMRDATSPTRHPAHYGPPPGPSPSSSSSSSSYGGAPPAANGHNVHVPDVNLPQGQPGTPINAAPRPYPPPPTGHDLMRLFPPPPPSQFSELKGGPTSYYFQRQERAFFAQAGREQIRIRLDAEFAPRPSPPTANTPAPTSMPRNWAPPQAPAHPHPSSHMPPAAGVPAPAQDDDDDESWRRPTPYNERRRAGKHTKRTVKP